MCLSFGHILAFMKSTPNKKSTNVNTAEKLFQHKGNKTTLIQHLKNFIKSHYHIDVNMALLSTNWSPNGISADQKYYIIVGLPQIYGYQHM